MIERVKSFREPNYLPQVEFKNIWSLVEKVIDLGEREGDHRYSRRLLELCPKPVSTPLDEVKKLLRTKYMPRNWWGWDALGIGRQKREQIIKESNEKNEKKRKSKNYV